ncbi:hypothetical protein LXL04_017561 [Taraxacum kok-saghyz]
MNGRRNSGGLFFFVFLTSISYLVTVTSHRCWYTKWLVTITNGVKDTIDVHIKSTDHDIGHYMIPFKKKFSWKFCSKLIGTHWTGYFLWGSKHAALALMDKEIEARCHNVSKADQSCFWLVMSDGFYLSYDNATFPAGWRKKKSWE